MISRFNHKGAITIMDVLNSAPPLNEEHPNIDYTFVKRETPKYTFSNPLTNPTDILNLQLYWLDFLGDGVRARVDEKFLAEKIQNTMCRLNSYWDNRILAQFDFEWTKRSAITGNPQKYEDWLNYIRKQTNDYWKNAYSLNSQLESRHERIEALKKIYKGDWQEYIWRILDIDEIGMFFDEYNPVYKKCEDDKKNMAKYSFGVTRTAPVRTMKKKNIKRHPAILKMLGQRTRVGDKRLKILKDMAEVGGTYENEYKEALQNNIEMDKI
tara:strand:+ start:414 stop:1217 length:804 start_codon:yes stop_codon:yes gene_type:complete